MQSKCSPIGTRRPDFECHTPVVSYDYVTKEGKKMAIFEFSDDFDAQGWYTEQMIKGRFDDYYEEG